jgi:hypothetical protein
MKFCVIFQQTSHNAQSPVRVVEQTTGRGVGWINRYLDREYVRRLANTTLRIYARNLLHFVRWWESVHHIGDVREGDLASPRSWNVEDLHSRHSELPPAGDRGTVIERARPGFADSSFLGRDFSMDAEVAHMHRIVRSSEAAVRFGLRSDNPIPAEIAERFSVRSQICLAVDPTSRKDVVLASRERD